jgi:chorismate mutase
LTSGIDSDKLGKICNELITYLQRYDYSQLSPVYLPLLLRYPYSGCRWRRLNREEEISPSQTRDQRSRVFRYQEAGSMSVRGIRGATTVDEDQPEAILQATEELLVAIQRANPSLRPGAIASALFTVTEDLQSVYPAQAARGIGWDRVPLMCAQEIPVPGSVARCVRVLIHWNTDLPGEDVRHVYLRQAVSLRPDLAG